MSNFFSVQRGAKINIPKTAIEKLPDWKIQEDIRESELRMLDFLVAQGLIEKVTLPKESKKDSKKEKIKKGINKITIIKPELPTELFFNKYKWRALQMAVSDLKEKLKQISEPEPTVAPVVEESEPDDRQIILNMIKDKGGPSEAEIEKLKKEHGGVYTLVLSKDEIYIFTHLTVEDYRSVTEALQSSTDPKKQFSVTELVVMECLLWPKLNDKTILKEKAGTIESLNKAIMLNSYFINEQTIRQFTFVL